MRLLLDTHVAIWALIRPGRLPPFVTQMIASPQNLIHVSAASVWEIGIKHKLGKRDAPPFSGRTAATFFTEAGYHSVPVTEAHAAAVEDLPLLHADPFDRIIVAQALIEPFRLITRDAQVAAYSSSIVTW